MTTTFVEDGIRLTRGRAGAFCVDEMEFPPEYREAPYEPAAPYVAVVLEGALFKTFTRETCDLAACSIVTIPAGATHAAGFGRSGARVLALRLPPDAGLIDEFPGVFREHRRIRDGAVTSLSWRLAGEVTADDSAAPLAAEGLALEVVAALARRVREPARDRRPPAWLASAEELLHADLGARLRLSDVAAAVGVHPAHLARVFREQHGTSVGGYVRRLRLEWAASQLISSDAPLASISAQAGFSDQSHFTRAFKRHSGLTPGRYRQTHRS